MPFFVPFLRFFEAIVMRTIIATSFAAALAHSKRIFRTSLLPGTSHISRFLVAIIVQHNDLDGAIVKGSLPAAS